jgi:hypothetical protein
MMNLGMGSLMPNISPDVIQRAIAQYQGSMAPSQSMAPQSSPLDSYRTQLVGNKADRNQVVSAYTSFLGRQPTPYEIEYYTGRKRGGELFNDVIASNFGKPAPAPTTAWFGPSGPSPIPQGSPLLNVPQAPQSGGQGGVTNFGMGLTPQNPAQPNPGSFMAQAMGLSGVPQQPQQVNKQVPAFGALPNPGGNVPTPWTQFGGLLG